MSNPEEEKKALDGFDGFTDEMESTDDGGQSVPSSIIQGTLLKFTNDATWEIRGGEEVSPDLELIAVDILRILQKWVNQMPVETRILEHGEKVPSLELLNSKCAKGEWSKDLNGNPRLVRHVDEDALQPDRAPAAALSDQALGRARQR
jgi:hypothetical protein